MAEVNMGTLYDVNKNIMLKQEPISCQEWKNKSKELVDFCKKTENQYYMLLNRETCDFTLFDFGSKNNHASLNTRRIIYDELKVCLQNRGKIISIDETEDKNAYEIWLNIKDEMFLYYFFPYDEGVIN